MDKPRPQIITPPPGPKAKKMMERDNQVISSSFTRWYPLVVESGKGMCVVDVDGNSST